MLLLLGWTGLAGHGGACRAAHQDRGRGSSAATTTTATTRGAAQIDRAAFGEQQLKTGSHAAHNTRRHRDQANSGSSAERRSAALGTPVVRYRGRPSPSKMMVVGRDSTESRRAASGLSSMSISTWATAGSSAQT